MQQHLTVTVLDKDPEGLHKAMDFLLPLEVWSDCQIHLKRHVNSNAVALDIVAKYQLE